MGPLSPLESEWAPLFFPSFFQQGKERGALQSESVGLDVARLESFRKVSNESWKESLSEDVMRVVGFWQKGRRHSVGSIAGRAVDDHALNKLAF